MGRLVDMFGEGQGGLQFIMEHTWLCGLVVLAGGAATFCRLYLIETAIERIAFRLPLETRILLRADLQVGCSGLWCGKIRKRCLRPG